MSIRKTLMASVALAIAVAFSPLSDLQAATLVSPGSQPGTDNLAQSVKMKRKGKMMHKMKHHRMGRHMRHRMGKHARSKGPGRCGMNMYYSRKMHHCMDARNK